MIRIWFFIHGSFKSLTCLLAALLMLLPGATSTFGQVSEGTGKADYRKIFGEQYTEAESYFDETGWIGDSLLSNRISPDFGKAIVFPEAIRFSSIRDKLEMQGLFTLYVQYGSKYANFSVGRFQMKPSFARQVEGDVFRIFGNSDTVIGRVDTNDTPNARMDRVKRLESEHWQVQYLVWFMKIMDHRYGVNYGKDIPEKLRFYATAYNCGYTRKAEMILKSMEKSTFHNAIFNSEVKYNYADIALDYYNSRR